MDSFGELADRSHQTELGTSGKDYVELPMRRLASGLVRLAARLVREGRCLGSYGLFSWILHAGALLSFSARP